MNMLTKFCHWRYKHSTGGGFESHDTLRRRDEGLVLRCAKGAVTDSQETVNKTVNRGLFRVFESYLTASDTVSVIVPDCTKEEILVCSVIALVSALFRCIYSQSSRR